MNAVEHDIEHFLYRELKVDASDPLFTREVDLFDAGYVDSIGFAELLGFIQERYGVDVPEDDLLSDDFSTIDGIAAIVRRLAPPAGEVVARVDYIDQGAA
jgi:D-alanine--poly(phosphoribitol) ligase subunit 2